MKSIIIVMLAALLGGCSSIQVALPDPDPCHDKMYTFAQADAPKHKKVKEFVWQSTLPKRPEPDPRFTGATEGFDPMEGFLR